MALVKKTASFENEPTTDTSADTAVAEQPDIKVETLKAEVKQEPAMATTVAIAKASASSLATSDAAVQAKKFQKEFEEMRGASDFSYGNYKLFKGNNGSIVESGKDGGDDLGRWAKIRIISWAPHYEMSPGESGASSKDFVAYSKDGITVDSVIGQEMQKWVGSSVADYMEYMRKEEGFQQAKKRQFIDMGCALLECDSGEGPLNKVIQITLSETSIPSFSRYQQELKDTVRCMAMGLAGFSMPEDPFQLYVVREVASKGQNRWTKLSLTTSLPAKL